MKTGLVSISFRQLAPIEIIQLCLDNHLEGIEWGGDVHVPPGDPERAAEVQSLTQQAGLKVAAYGSYYVLKGSVLKSSVLAGTGTKNRHSFESVLESAVALGAPLIRVWAGAKGSDVATPQDWRDAVEDSRRLGDMAAAHGIKIAFEYHHGTLTDTNESAVRLLNETDHPNVVSFWQPPNGADVDYCYKGLENLLKSGRLASVHAFHWWPGFKDRQPLAMGGQRWQRYLALVHQYDLEASYKTSSEDESRAGERYVCLEFVVDDNPKNLTADARTLNKWIAELKTSAEHATK